MAHTYMCGCREWGTLSTGGQQHATMGRAFQTSPAGQGACRACRAGKRPQGRGAPVALREPAADAGGVEGVAAGQGLAGGVHVHRGGRPWGASPQQAQGGPRQGHPHLPPAHGAAAIHALHMLLGRILHPSGRPACGQWQVQSEHCISKLSHTLSAQCVQHKADLASSRRRA